MNSILKELLIGSDTYTANTDESRIVRHIKKRENIEPELWSVKEALEAHGVGIYGNICCERIVSGEKIDGKHVLICFSQPGDILIDHIGLIKCEEIMSCYIPQENLDIMYEYWVSRKKVIDSQNNIIDMLRRLSKKTLKNMARKAKDKSIHMEDAERQVFLVMEELKARKIKNVIWQKVRKKMVVAFVYIKYYKILRFLRICLSTYRKEEKEKQS